MVMHVHLAITGIPEQSKLRVDTVEEAYIYSMLHITGTTKLTIGDLELTNDREIIYRCVELLTCILELGSHKRTVMSFDFEPVAIAVQIVDEVVFYDYFDEAIILERSRVSDLESVADGIEHFIDVSLRPIAPALADFFSTRKYYRANYNTGVTRLP